MIQFNSQEIRFNERSGLGLCFFAILMWIFLEYGRPANPLRLPLIISTLLFANWLFLPAKRWNPQIVCFLLLLGVMSLSGTFAVNHYSAFWTTYGMIVLLLFNCIPLIHFVDSLRKLAILINVYLFVFLYVGVYAIFHSGFGPAGSDGAQDENYVAAMMCMAIPLAYFSIFIVNSKFKKLTLIGALGVCGIAVIVGLSRGGFVGMAVVFLYCLFRSPKKGMALAVGSMAVLLVCAVASDQYWREMSTISDTSESTADLRLESWEIAFRMFQENLLVGVGPDNFKWNVSTYQSAQQLAKYDRGLFLLTHSVFFELLSELGLMGTGLFATVVFFNFKDLKFISSQVRVAERLSDKTETTVTDHGGFVNDCRRIRCYAYALTGSSLAFLATFTFISGLYFSSFWVLTAMIVALKEITIEFLGRQGIHATVLKQQKLLYTAPAWQPPRRTMVPQSTDLNPTRWSK